MPIYEYACTVCGHRLDAMQKIGDTPLCVCPACRAPALSKQMSATGIRVKGVNARRMDAEPVCGAGACPACLPD